MIRRRYRMILPLILGSVTGLLMVWDLHNYAVIASMGTAWDTGPPLWYEASWIALVSIDAPAYIISTPLFLVFHLQTAPQRYPVFFPAAIVWWWWLGRRFDNGLLPSRNDQHRWLIGAGLMIGALALFTLGTLVILDYTQWWFQYGFPALRLLRTGGPMLWCFAIAIVLTISALRVAGIRRSSTRQ